MRRPLALSGLLLFASLALAACSSTAPPESDGPTAGPPVPPAADALGAYVLGIDVSRYQAAVNWADLRANGIGFVYLKASEGESVPNPYFEQHRQGATAAGMPWGAYHFFRPETPVETQIQLFARALGSQTGDLPPVLDVEVDGGVPTDTLQARAVRMARAMEALTGRRPMVYAGAAFYRDRLAPALAPYPLWVAQYRDTLPDDDRWTVWQFTDAARLRGVGNQPVSLSVFRGTPADLLRIGR